MILVSACLIGCQCRYDGNANTNALLQQWFLEGKLMPICPEVLGGLATPRPSCEIQNNNEGKLCVVTKDHQEVTAAFEKGAQVSLDIGKAVGAHMAILKSRSPSCGYGQIYDGQFCKQLVEGNGLTAELLASHGLKIYNEDNFETALF